ncbi:MAG TPA: hypothetical protein VGS23_09355 [Thermoplasmata archaeon]|nr:hypothetical protein [Thermoplasmata archaeon]
MSGLTADQIVYLTEILGTLAGIGITWLIYHGSERAELPGEAMVPDPRISAEPIVDNTGRTL